MIRVLHAADLHLDSPFSGLNPQAARERRRELRDLPDRLADLALERGVQLVLLAGDLFDGERVYPETLERLTAALARMACPVLIAPGNHDFCTPGGVYDRTDWPANVYIFRDPALEGVELPDLNAVVWGAAFTGPFREDSPLAGFAAPRDGRLHLAVLHGDAVTAGSAYGPIRREEIAASGLRCLCLGHIHRRLELDAGETVCRYPGCPEGRGFDELGPCGVLLGEVERGRQDWKFVPTAGRLYQILEIDVTGKTPAAALEAALPPETGRDLYRVIFTGEGAPDLEDLAERFRGRCWSLDLRDRTRVPRDIWERAGEDSLRGLFLARLRERFDAAGGEEERALVTLAVRFGLAALEGREL